MIFMMILRIIAKKRNRKVLIAFDDMTSHVMSNKKAQQVLKRTIHYVQKIKY